jgi:nucleotidyltransferase substrate binding protein (TIGR01987 family)
MTEKHIGKLNIEGLEKAFYFLNSFSVDNCTDQEKAGLVKAFEVCYELSWKMLKKTLFIKGINVASPRDAFREAALNDLIKDPRLWFKFLEERNKTVHTYNLELIEEIILKLIPEFKSEVSKLIKELQDVVEDRSK